MRGSKWLESSPQIITREEFGLLLEATSKKSKSGIRERAVLWLLFNCGLRKAELLSLEFNNIDMNINRIHLTITKGSKDRILFFNEDTKSALLDWFEVRNSIKSEKNLVFVTSKGTKIHPTFLNQNFKKLGKKAGIERKIYPHLFRHSCLTHTYEASNNNLVLTQMVAGHSNIQTTTIYAHVSGSAIKEAMMNF